MRRSLIRMPHNRQGLAKHHIAFNVFQIHLHGFGFTVDVDLAEKLQPDIRATD